MIAEILIALLCILVSLLLGIFLVKTWIKLTKTHPNMLQPDINKYGNPMVPKTGGIILLISITFAIFLYIFCKTFLLNSMTHVVETLSLVLVMLFAGFIGFIDDIFGWKKSKITGFKKILMTIPIAIPLMVINAGHSAINLPFIGNVNLGLLYPLLVIPIAIIGTTNGFNLLEGFNGLGASLGMVIFSALGLIAFFTGQVWLALIAAIVVASLLAFFIFNKNPAKILPGNAFTYIVGSLIGCFAILGNMEKAALIIFIPHIVEGFLKLRSKFKAHCMGIPNPDNSLELRYKESYSWTHIAMKVIKKIKGKVFETEVVLLIVIIELIFALLTLMNVLFGII
jgi:UDP-N-acetylglucosamine--dolichyl-phosphate N-acetylglucosaminephosphotransferase